MNESDAMIPAPEARQLPFDRLMDSDSPGYFFTLAKPERSDRAALVRYAALLTKASKPDNDVREVLKETIRLRHIYAHPIRVVDKNTGELRDTVRIVFFDDDGMTYACVSEGVIQGVKQILDLFGPPSEWKEPLPIYFESSQTSNKNNVFNLFVADAQEPKPKRK